MGLGTRLGYISVYDYIIYVLVGQVEYTNGSSVLAYSCVQHKTCTSMGEVWGVYVQH